MQICKILDSDHQCSLTVPKPSSNSNNAVSRSFRSRPKSFDTSLSRLISLEGRKSKKISKVSTTGRMQHKLKLSAKKLSAKKKSTKSPRKTKLMVKRNLAFEDGKPEQMSLSASKSPRKLLTVTTPSKARKFAAARVRMTPGKQHRILCPETPQHKISRRKSDGNRVNH